MSKNMAIKQQQTTIQINCCDLCGETIEDQTKWWKLDDILLHPKCLNKIVNQKLKRNEFI
jgi:hypothetical protein